MDIKNIIYKCFCENLRIQLKTKAFGTDKDLINFRRPEVCQRTICVFASRISETVNRFIAENSYL